MKTLLHDEPPAIRLPFLLGLHELQVVLHEEGRDKLRPARQFSSMTQILRDRSKKKKKGARNSHFHPTDVPTQTHPRPGAKRKEEPLHVSVTPLGAVLAFGFGLLDPALWSENFNVVAEDSRVSVDDPRVSTHGRAGRDEFAGDCRAGRGRHAWEGHADGGMQAEGFVHDGLEVGKAVCLGEGDGEGELALVPGGVELGD